MEKSKSPLRRYKLKRIRLQLEVAWYFMKNEIERTRDRGIYRYIISNTRLFIDDTFYLLDTYVRIFQYDKFIHKSIEQILQVSNPKILEDLMRLPEIRIIKKISKHITCYNCEEFILLALYYQNFRTARLIYQLYGVNLENNGVEVDFVSGEIVTHTFRKKRSNLNRYQRKVIGQQVKFPRILLRILIIHILKC